MPQLDSLTYSAQFVYLLISFIGVYILTLQWIIPSVSTTQKLRQKLNTVALLDSKLDSFLDERTSTVPDLASKLACLARKCEAESFGLNLNLTQNQVKMINTYELLAVENLEYYAVPQSGWLGSSRMTQVCNTMLQQKVICADVIHMANDGILNDIDLVDIQDKDITFSYIAGCRDSLDSSDSSEVA
jgi:hypothetical protein